MRIDITDTANVKIIEKPWGWEKWIQAGDENHKYVFKQIFLKKGFRTSLQAHRLKSETIVILSGKGKLYTHRDKFDLDRFLNKTMSEDEVSKMLHEIEPIEIGPNSVIRIQPHTIHRVESTEDLLYFEASTTELDDVIRIQDDLNRPHNVV